MECLYIFRKHKWGWICNIYVKKRNRAKLIKGLYQCKRCKMVSVGVPVPDPTV